MSNNTNSAFSSVPHFKSLDGLRALSILLVLAAHMLPLGPKKFQFNMMAGIMGMSLFFALSGFLICMFLIKNPDPVTFFIRRIARIAPLVLIATFFYAILWEGRLDTFVGANLYLLNYWVSAISPATSPLWSLAVEVHFYLAIGLAVWLFGSRGVWLVIPASLAVTTLRINNNIFDSINTHLRVDEILVGCMIALLWTYREDPRVKYFWGFLPRFFWLFMALWLASCHPNLQPMGYLRPYATLMLVASILATKSGCKIRFLSIRTFRYVALISFSLYVLHSPFRHGWFDAGTDLERYFFKRPLAFGIIFFLAHMSTFCVEKPITDMARKIRVSY